MTDDDVVAPRRKVHASHRIASEEAELAVATSPYLHRSFTEALHAIKREAHKNRTLLANKPRVTITVEVRWDGFEFPEDAEDIYEAERVGQSLGMEVRDDIDHLVVRRVPRLS